MLMRIIRHLFLPRHSKPDINVDFSKVKKLLYPTIGRIAKEERPLAGNITGHMIYRDITTYGKQFTSYTHLPYHKRRSRVK